MVELLKDIEVLENLLIAMQEGASDEKRMALWSVERLLDAKRETIQKFESEYEESVSPL